MEESLVYGYGDLLADFGGYLGLLLGASLVSFYEIIVTSCQKLKLMYNSVLWIKQLFAKDVLIKNT